MHPVSMTNNSPSPGQNLDYRAQNWAQSEACNVEECKESHRQITLIISEPHVGYEYFYCVLDNASEKPCSVPKFWATA